MSASATARIRHAVLLLALFALAACADRGGTPDWRQERGIGVVSWKPGMTRTEYMAIPDSARLGGSGEFGMDRGVGVEVNVTLNGMQGQTVPLAYSLHDARNDVHSVSQTISMKSDAASWQKKGYVWLPVHSPGTYYVRVVLADSTGRSAEGPRTLDFTIQ
jgi:hypothetical protein